MCRIDLNIAFIEDRAPRYPVPISILPQIQITETVSTQAENALKACVSKDAAVTFGDLFAINRLMLQRSQTQDLWDEGIFAGLHIMPILSNLLLMDTRSCSNGPAIAAAEACKIGGILYIAAIRRKFGVYLPTDIYIPKLKDKILVWDACGTEDANQVLLWLLMIGGLQSWLHAEHEWFVVRTSVLILNMGYSSWDMVLTLVSEVLWIKEVFEVDCGHFHDAISSYLWSNYKVVI
jgi:hypothetical protein